MRRPPPAAAPALASLPSPPLAPPPLARRRPPRPLPRRSLDNNQIGDAGAAALAKALPECGSLETLNFNNNDKLTDDAKAKLRALDRVKEGALKIDF